MEYRKANLIIGAAGGNAGKGSETFKVSLPSAWVRSLALSREDRALELSFDGEKIVIRRAPIENGPDFPQDHDVRSFYYYDADQLCTVIRADLTDHSIWKEDHVSDPVKTAFGRNDHPVWSDFMDFLQERCLPRERDGLQNYLEALGIDSYDPIEIIRKTGGRMAEDAQWLEIRT